MLRPTRQEGRKLAIGIALSFCLGLSLKSYPQDLSDSSVTSSKAQEQAKPAENRSPLEPLPHPDLSGIEEAVLEQLQQTRSELVSLLGRPDAPASQLSEAYGKMGMVYQAYGLEEAAKTCYLNARSLAPPELKWNYYLGYLYRSMGDLQKAVDYFQKAKEIRPDEIVLLRLAEASLELGHPESARALFERVAVNNPSAAAMFGLGKIALREHNFIKAVDYFKQALALQPQASAVHYPLAMAYRGLGDLDQSLSQLAMQGQAMPVVSDPWLVELEDLKKGKANLLMQAYQAIDAGHFADAVQPLRTVVAMAPTDPSARIYLGVALARGGDLQEAIKQFSDALRLAPDDAQGHYCLGVTLLALRSEQEAMEHFEAAVKADPGLKTAHFQLANVLMRGERYGDAAREYSQVVRIEPGNGFARLMEAMALVRLGDYSGARDRLERAHRLLPDDVDIANALARLLAACPEETVRNGSRALLLIQQTIKAEKSVDVDQGQTMAMALAEMGQFAHAAEVQRLVIDNLEYSNDSHILLLLRDNLALYERGQACRVPWRDDDPIFFPVPKKPELPDIPPLTTQR